MMQRKMYIFCLALSLISFIPYSHAQKGKSEISVAYGLYSSYNIWVGRPYSNSSGVGMLNYKYYYSNRITFGGVIGYENINNWGSYLTFAPEFTYTYFDNKDDRIRVKLYGGVSAGLTVFDDFVKYDNLYAQHKDVTGAQFTGHVMPFGMRIGRRFGGFLELGYGYKGIFNFGASYRFRTHGRRHTEQ